MGESPKNQRIFSRMAYEDKVSYVDGNSHKGVASSVDIGWGGTALRMGRYLRPGTTIEMKFDRPDEHRESLAFQGEVTWCQPTADKQRFHVGVRASLMESTAMQTLSALMLNAVLNPGQMEPATVTRTAEDSERNESTMGSWLRHRRNVLEVA